MNGLSRFGSSIQANLLREVLSQIQASRIGLLWPLMEYFVTLMIFFAIRYLRGASMPIEVDLFTALLLGFYPYFLCRGSMQIAANCVKRNRGLLFYSGMRHFDLALSATIAEWLLVTCSVICGLVINYTFFNPIPSPADPLAMLLCMCGAWLLGVGIGLSSMTLATLFPAFRGIFNMLTRPLLFISGVMYTATEIPSAAYPYLAWNPLFHLTELMRESFSTVYHSPFADGLYVAYWVAGAWALGLAAERYLRLNIRSN